MIVVDTSVWILAIRNVDRPSTRRLWEEADRASILLCDIVMFEVLRGARDDLHARRLQKYLSSFPRGETMAGELPIRAARNYRHLRSVGITSRSLADVIIATFCIEGGHDLLHDDRDFVPMAEHLGLRLL